MKGMNRVVGLVALLLLARPATAQDDERGALMLAGEALSQPTCEQCAKRIMRGIEEFTRMKFRRPVSISVQPRAVWEQLIKQEGYNGHAAKQGAAFYFPLGNAVTVVPWVIGGYQSDSPPKLSKAEWVARLESTIIHEYTHALHYQNFHIVPSGSQMASLRTGGLTALQKDESTVDFLIAEGFAELVPWRIAEIEARKLTRRPERELMAAQRYWDRYQPNGKDPYRVLLFNNGYQDGLDLLERLTRKAGPRALRGILYRVPTRELLFQPDILATVPFDDPPNPDSIFGFLSPDALTFGEVHLAVYPGKDRFFRRARSRTGTRRQDGCLLGFMAGRGSDKDPQGESMYSFFVADPDAPGDWSARQAESLRALEPTATKTRSVALKLLPGVKADVIEVKLENGTLWLRAEAGGMVVMARETNPTKNLEERVLLALRALQIRKPTPNLYGKALAEARKQIDKSAAD